MASKKKKGILYTLKIIKNIILWLLIAALVLVLVFTLISRITGNEPSLFGFSLYRVSSGSMRPELEVGDVIFVRKCEGESVHAGDIITFDGTSGDLAGKLVTHRVITAPYEENGEVFLVTKGDANSIGDDPINVNQVRGVVITKVPPLRFLFDFFSTPWGLLAIIALIILAFFNEILNFVKSLFGIGYEPEPQEGVEEIIERIKKEGNKSEGVETELSENVETDTVTEEQ